MRRSFLFVINQFYNGGAELSLLRLLRLLVCHGDATSLVIYDMRDADVAISLVHEVPKETRLCVGHSQTGDASVYEFVSGSRYDLAVSVGEWHSPEIVLRYANAMRRAIWIHADVMSATIPVAADLFDYGRLVDAWICVSADQCQKLRDAAPFLRGAFVVVHNPVDRAALLRAREEPLDLPDVCRGRRIAVMVGNLRPAKNYIRAVEAASLLAHCGTDIVWLVCGNLADTKYVRLVRSAIARNGLTDRFILLGAQENPWKYIDKADVFVSTSDTESWCMAISEALTLGVPVVATATAGASEQLKGEKLAGGVLCDFSGRSIAAGIRKIVGGACPTRSRVSSLLYDSLQEFISVCEIPPLRYAQEQAVVVVDDANYCGGAHIATIRMLEKMHKRGVECAVFSGVRPSFETRCRYAPAEIVYAQLDWRTRIYYECGARDFLRLPGVPLLIKGRKVILSILRRIARNRNWGASFDQVLGARITDILSRYEVVVVMSEASKFRELVAALPKRIRKVQLIHTFYTLWRNFSFWTREITAEDGRLYAQMSKVALIGTRNAKAFSVCYPELADRVAAFHNVITTSSCRSDSRRSTEIRLVTVARLEEEKDIPRLLRVAYRLKALGVSYRWDIYGDGSARKTAETSCEKLGLTGVVRFGGYAKDPCERMREADLFVLLSHYEGLPNVIYESLLVGTPVFSTDVGGIPEQVKDHEAGRLVADDETAIVEGLAEVLRQPSVISRWKENLKGYRYDNDAAVQEFMDILGLK